MHRVYCLGFAALLMGVIPFASAEKTCAGGDGADASSAHRVACEHFDQDLSKTMRVGAQEGLKRFLARMENYQIRICLEGDPRRPPGLSSGRV